MAPERMIVVVKLTKLNIRMAGRKNVGKPKKEVGAGAYPWHTLNDSLESDRGLFLQIARRCDLRIMIDLLMGPSQLYVELLSQYAHTRDGGKLTWEEIQSFLPDWNAVDLETKSAPPESTPVTFKNSLFEWSVRWHLDADWCRDRAIGAMRLWGLNKSAQLYLCWDNLDLWGCVQEKLEIINELSEDEQEFLRSIKDDPRTFGIRVNPASAPRREWLRDIIFDSQAPKPPGKLPARLFLVGTADDYIKSAREVLEQDPSNRKPFIDVMLRGPARQYCEKFERYYKELGWKPARQKPDHVRHLIWAALHQILGVDCRQIAADYPLIETGSVCQAISRTLKRLQLPNRKKQGRPPKTTSKVNNH